MLQMVCTLIWQQVIEDGFYEEKFVSLILLIKNLRYKYNHCKSKKYLHIHYQDI